MTAPRMETAATDSAPPAISPEQFRANVQKIEDEVGKVIVGQKPLIRMALVTMLANSHALLEGVPGLGKTMLVRTMSQVVSCEFGRIQFTPDLMPADITGTNLLVEDEKGALSLQFQRGPLFGNLVLADEINRATPKTQSALLEAMQEGSVSIARTTYKLPQPFFLLATQNPLEMEGTYPLPEAQLDRFFFKLLVEFPTAEELIEISERTTSGIAPDVHPVVTGADILAMQALARQTPIASHVTAYAARLLRATHPDNPEATTTVRKYVRYGGSPRAMQAMVLAGKVMALLDGRFNVSFKDIRAAAAPALRHRIILNFDGEAEGISPDSIISAVLEETATEPKQ